MKPKKLLCIPNFSEGRDPQVIRALLDAVLSSGAKVIEASWDTDHHRMVLAFEGDFEQVENAYFALAQAAIRHIDLRQHWGEHPRLGAMDVAPLVPLQNVSLEEAITLSHRIAEKIALNLDIPVYLYEKSAIEGRESALPVLRKGGFEAWVAQPLEGARAPDFGPAHLHPTAGAIVMGVREPLIAFNVNLRTSDLTIAQQIAKEIRSQRASDPRLKGVRAIGVNLESRKSAQVSLNLTRPDEVNLYEVYRFIEQRAQELGVEVAESELIGILRHDDLLKAFNAAIKAQVKPGQIVGWEEA